MSTSILLQAKEKTLILVYKELGKAPYIQAAPDNSGLYYDMMSRAAQKIGFELIIERYPKKRTYSMLENGTAELYASGEFYIHRSEFLYYFPNGLYRNADFYGITSMSIPEIENISDISNHNLIWCVELGSSWALKAESLGVRYNEISNARIEVAVKLLHLKRPFFFHIQKKDIEKYLIDNGISSLEEIGIKIHKKCGLNKQEPLYTAFSRFSPYYSEQPNPLYDKSKPTSPENFPIEPIANSVPEQLKNALQEMIVNGETAKMIAKYNLIFGDIK